MTNYTGGLAPIAIAGIVVGLLVLVSAVAGVGFYFYKKGQNGNSGNNVIVGVLSGNGSGSNVNALNTNLNKNALNTNLNKNALNTNLNKNALNTNLNKNALNTNLDANKIKVGLPPVEYSADALGVDGSTITVEYGHLPVPYPTTMFQLPSEADLAIINEMLTIYDSMSPTDRKMYANILGELNGAVAGVVTIGDDNLRVNMQVSTGKILSIDSASGFGSDYDPSSMWVAIRNNGELKSVYDSNVMYLNFQSFSNPANTYLLYYRDYHRFSIASLYSMDNAGAGGASTGNASASLDSFNALPNYYIDSTIDSIGWDNQEMSANDASLCAKSCLEYPDCHSFVHDGGKCWFRTINSGGPYIRSGWTSYIKK